MFPSFTLGKFTTEIELKGVAAYEAVGAALPWAGWGGPDSRGGLAGRGAAGGRGCACAGAS